jgi:hypothetical protein
MSAFGGKADLQLKCGFKGSDNALRLLDRGELSSHPPILEGSALTYHAWKVPLYRAVLLGDDTSSACPGLRLNLREHLRLARTCPSYRLWCLGDLVDDRTPMGQVLERLMSAIGTKQTLRLPQ